MDEMTTTEALAELKAAGYGFSRLVRGNDVAKAIHRIVTR